MQPAIQTDPDAFAHVETWVFDLDNTLYPARCSAYPEIDRRIRAYIATALGLSEDEAHLQQKHYFHTYGTSLLGMTHEHGTDPKAFLQYVHDVDLACIPPDPDLGEALGALRGRKIIFTNADTPYAELVLERLGIRSHFEAIFDIEAAAYLPKPYLATYRRMLATHGIAPATAAMVDDLPRNLAPAAKLGMTTVWVKNDAEWVVLDAGMARHHVVEHLGSWIRAIAARN